MNKHGYMHLDLYFSNIGINFTKDIYINILNKNIVTNGLLVEIIDYGMIINKKYGLDTWELAQFKYKDEMDMLLEKMVNKRIEIGNDEKKILKHYLKDIV
jgi:hypothetical protein